MLRDKAGHSKIEVCELVTAEVQEFIRLQDFFAEEHRILSSSLYPALTLRDWQLVLCCPASVLNAPGGRECHIVNIVQRNQECFKSLFILKAMAVSNDNSTEPRMIGYIMYQVHGGVGRRRKGASRDLHVENWVQVKQIFVHRDFRKKGCGGILFAKMLEAVSPNERRDLRLSVLDLNTRAMEWYRAQGFVVVDIRKEFVGEREESNAIVYAEMERRLHDSDGHLSWAELWVPSIFKTEVLGEVITIDYPDKSGVFVVRIVDYDEETRWHKVNSNGLSRWDGEDFIDEIDLNFYYRDGHVKFMRHLSLILRDIEMKRRAEKRQKAEAKALHLAELERERKKQEEELLRAGRAERKRRKLQV